MAVSADDGRYNGRNTSEVTETVILCRVDPGISLENSMLVR